MKNFQFPISNFQLQIDKVWRALLLAFCFALIVLEFGCARTVTVLPDAGNQLQLEITFRGEIDPSANRYYLVLSGTSVLLPYTGTYFFGPGEAYDTDKLNVSTDLAYYYTNYYSTWTDFILLKDSSFLITNGAFVSSTLHTTYTPSLLIFRTIPSEDPDANKKINLTLFFNRLSSLPSTLYFNFISVDKDGYMRDYLRSTDNSISTNTGSAISEKRETEDPAIDGGLDIISWNMVVQ